MRKISLTRFKNGAKSIVKNHGAEILTGIGIGLGGTTVVLAVSATPKAVRLLEAEKARINREIINEAAANGEETCLQIDKLKPLDTVKVAWKCYIPAFATGLLSATCIIGASSIHVRRNAALVAAYALTESNFKTYREKVVEAIGDEKEKEVRKETAKEQAKKAVIPEERSYIPQEQGDYWCYDIYSGRKFLSNEVKIEKAVNKLNAKLFNKFSGDASLNDLYDFLDSPVLTRTAVSDELGWRIDSVGDGITVDFAAIEDDSDGIPCKVFYLSVEPDYEFRGHY